MAWVCEAQSVRELDLRVGRVSRGFAISPAPARESAGFYMRPVLQSRACIRSPLGESVLPQFLLCSSRFGRGGSTARHLSLPKTTGRISALQPVRICDMPDRPAIDRQIHDLLDEVNLLQLEMMLPGSKAGGKALAMVFRLRECAEQAREAGKDKSAQRLREVASMLEKEAIQSTP